MNETQLQDSIKRIHQESNESRIKLMTLRACYTNVCDAFHDIVCVTHGNQARGSNWRKCPNVGCKSNHDVLKKLELE